MEVYIDDMLVKSLDAGNHLRHLQETFDILREHNMKLNPEKYAFRVRSGKFLGFLVSQRGIEVNLDKFKAIEDIPDQLSNVKEVQRLTGRLVALSRWSFKRERVRTQDSLDHTFGGNLKVETGPYQNIREREVVNFLWENIICRLETAKGHWPKELPGVLWAYRTTAKSSTGETHFSLVYGVEALILVEIGEPTLSYLQADEESNNEAMLINLELLEEYRDLAHVRMAAQKQRMERYYNLRTNLRYFKMGDLALRKVTENTRELNAGKLAST
ncbi:uncharacterized protein [Nicotiana tomentosiformis]|uniref:uncharacterized protein n=1 Tax=Nicotiana tomentosiformis TaxID=4098 RepID=UPI00388C403A